VLSYRNENNYVPSKIDMLKGYNLSQASEGLHPKLKCRLLKWENPNKKMKKQIGRQLRKNPGW
jgi:hypothetical protein